MVSLNERRSFRDSSEVFNDMRYKRVPLPVPEATYDRPARASD